MTNVRDYSTLSWIKGEVDELIAQARGALADFVEGESEDGALMETCAEKLHKVHATLKIVEVYGAAMLAEEMEQLALAIGKGEVRQPDEGAETLMLALIQLPDYLEKLQTGEPDIPLVLLPLINDLRTAREGTLLSEAALFHPDLEQGSLPLRVTGAPNPDLQRLARKFRAVYHQGLVGWYRGLAPEVGLRKLRDVVAVLETMAATAPAFHLFQATHALIEGLLDTSIEGSHTIKQLLARFDRQMKLILEHGEGALGGPSTQDLVKNLLYYIARAESDNPLIQEVHTAYNLGQAIPSTEALSAVRESLSAPSLEMLKTVHGAIKEDLLKVKDTLDLYIRSSENRLENLLALAKPLRMVADTLGMLGRGALRLRLIDEVEKIQRAGESGEAPEEEALMDMAGAILFVENSLDGQVASRWQPREDVELVTATMREVRAEMVRAKDAILRFVAAPENLESLHDVPAWFHNIAGALRILEFPEPAEILDDLSIYLKREVLATGQVPELASLEALADGISSIEYFSEALVEGRGADAREQILATAREAMGRLEKIAAPAAASPEAETETPRTMAEPVGESDAGSVEPAVVQAPAQTESTASPEQAAPAAEAVDPEILEIFVEEAREELQVIREHYPRWRRNPDDQESLLTFRRSFHTLKGSGRLVGAMAIGEYAWSIENLLNRVIDGAIPASPDIMVVMDTALETLPALIDDLEVGREPALDIEGLSQRASALTSPEHRPETEPVDEYAAQAPGPQEEETEDEGESAPPRPAALEEVPAWQPVPEPSAVGEQEIDEEILEIFLEEAREETEVVREYLPRWKQNPQDDEALRTLRRSFHTLKGSGRLVGATIIGEFAWSIENLINRVMEERVPVTDRLFALLDDTVRILPELIDNQESGKISNTQVQPLVERAESLASGTPEVETEPVLGASEPATGELLPDVAETMAAASDELASAQEIEPELAGVAQEQVPEPEPEPESVEALSAALEQPEAEEPLEAVADQLDVKLETVEVLAAVPEDLEAAEPAALEPVAEVEPLTLEPESEEALARAPEETAAVEPFQTELAAEAEQPLTAPEVEPAETVAEGAEQADAEEPFEPAAEAERPEDALASIVATASGEEKTEASVAPEEAAGALEELEPTEPEGPEPEFEPLSAEAMADSTEQSQVQQSIEPELELAAEDLQEETDELAGVRESAEAEQPEDALASIAANASGEEETEASSVLEKPTDALEELEPTEPERPEPEFEPLSAEALADSAEQSQVQQSIEPELELAAEDLLEEIDELAEVRESAEEEQAEASALRFGMDPVLYEIFESECREHLQTLADLVESCHQRPGLCVITERVARAFHTLHGSAHMAEVEPMAKVGSALEHLVNELRLKAIPADDRVIDLINEGQFVMRSLLDSIVATDMELPEIDGFLRRVAEVQDDLIAEQAVAQAEVEAAAESEASGARYAEISGDPELIEIFLEEARDLLEMLDASLREWRNDPAESRVLVELQRTLHTLKGGARLAGIMPLGDLSHAYETLLTGVVSGDVQPSPEVLELAQDTADWLSSQVEEVATSQRVKSADTLIEMLEAARSGRLKKVPVEPVPEAASEDAEAFVPTEVQRPHQEQIRVRADLLDRLVNNAGEVSIYRSRIEQQSSNIGYNLAELEQTVERLRAQLRKLEIETETQILFRFERDRDAEDLNEDFDPLEMDRFSTMQQLSRSLMETVNDLVNITDVMDELNRANETLLLQQARVSTDLQDGLLRTRMVPFSQVVPRLHRLVRQTAKSVGKQAGLEVYGADEELDRNILERMLAPLEHILRNAVSHGIELARDRRAVDKPETGRISVYVGREGTDVLLNVVDDGTGMNLEAIRRRAIERGLLKSGAKVSDDDVMQFVLTPGFSTAAEVTQVAGRGVGMDVVASGIKQLGGSLEMDSQPGRGTSFTIRLPLTLAISEALLAQVAEEIYAIPYASIEGVVRIGRDELQDFYRDNQRLYSYAGHDYQVRHLGGLLGTAALNLAEGMRWFPVLLVRAGDRRVALQVDGLLGNRQIVVKSVGPQLSSIHWITGATILGDGRVALILDLTAMIRMDAAKTISPQTVSEDVPEDGGVTVMVVDDSITVRKVTARLLGRHNMTVISAKDGMDAVTKLQERIPDIMLLDIEMPRMDGFEVARHMRNTEELKEIPVIMITSRTGEKHRQRALELGVQRYLGKPYQETELLDNIYSVLSEVKT